MIALCPTPPGLLFASVLYRADLHTQETLMGVWQAAFGESDHLAPEFNPLTEYYAREMGSPLGRFLCLTQGLHPREHLLRAKLQALEWERGWATDQRRSVNVDVGLLSAENFILATTKNYSHRIFLSDDIFAELTFQYQQGDFQALPWTYPDYRDPEKLAFLRAGRQRLLKLLSLSPRS
jgi:hypothetical protein